MSIQTFQITGTIAIPISSVNGDEIVPIYDGAAKSNPRLVPANTIISANSFVKNLRCMAKIESLLPVDLPDFGLADSQTEKLKKTLALEWDSPRKQIDLFIKNRFSDWLKVFSISLLNPGGYPFRVYSLMEAYGSGLAIELGADGQIGAAVVDVSFGLLDPLDEVTVFGSWVQEIVVYVEKPPIIINVSGGGGTVTPPPPVGTLAWSDMTFDQWLTMTFTQWKEL